MGYTTVERLNSIASVTEMNVEEFDHHVDGYFHHQDILKVLSQTDDSKNIIVTSVELVDVVTPSDGSHCWGLIAVTFDGAGNITRRWNNPQDFVALKCPPRTHNGGAFIANP